MAKQLAAIRVNGIRPCLILLYSLLLAGCASTSLFQPYTFQGQKYKTSLSGEPVTLNASIEKELLKKAESADGLLYAQELGRLYQLTGQYEASKEAFAQVYKAYKAEDEKAVISASEIGANSIALISNDNAIPYQGYTYERIMALHFQALNYLAIGDIEGTAVELRRAALEQRIQEEKNAKKVERAEKDATSNDIDHNQWRNNPQLSGLNTLASKVKSAIQNPYTYYTSAVLWENLGNINAALVDYKKALELNPDSNTLLNDVKRLSNYKPNKRSADLVILFEEGFVPMRQSVDISIPYLTDDHITYTSVSIPFYPKQSRINTLGVNKNGQNLGRTEIIANVGAMAGRALLESLPASIIRMVLRARAKHELHKQNTQQAGSLGSLFATLYNIISTKADKRSWLTLPNSAQVFRTQLTPGTHQLELTLPNQTQSISVNTKAGQTSLIRVIDMNNRMIIESYTL